MCSNRSLSVLISLYTSVWIVMVLMGPNRSIFVFMDCNGSLWVLMVPYASL